MEMQKCQGEFVYLDLTGLDPERVKKRFPRIYSTCLQYNIDISTDLVPVQPAAHYAMGGVATDLHGATSLKGLYAAGEVAATGVHGANRLASNSLLEGLVYGARAASAMINRRAANSEHLAQAAVAASPACSSRNSGPPAATGDQDLEKLTNQVRSILWEKVGIIRNGKDLCDAVKRLEGLASPPASLKTRQSYEAQNILEVARLIARSALARQESRGAHYRSDFPLKSAPKHSFVSKNSSVYFE
jgi:L-aspartate oxidase